MKKRKFDEFTEGMDLEPVKFGPVKHMDLVRYAGASGDFNPIHTDPEFVKQVGLDGTIAHGMFVMAQIGKLLTQNFHLHQIYKFGVKFKGMTKLGETIISTARVKKKKEENGKKIVHLTVQAASESGDVKSAGDVEIICE